MLKEERMTTKSKTPATDALSSPATRRLVHEALALAVGRDIVDAIHDLEHAVAVLRERFYGDLATAGIRR